MPNVARLVEHTTKAVASRLESEFRHGLVTAAFGAVASVWPVQRTRPEWTRSGRPDGTIKLNREQRDAIHGELVLDLSGTGDIRINLDGEDYDAAHW